MGALVPTRLPDLTAILYIYRSESPGQPISVFGPPWCPVHRRLRRPERSLSRLEAGIQITQEDKELLVSMARLAFGEDGAGGNVKSREEVVVPWRT